MAFYFIRFMQYLWLKYWWDNFACETICAILNEKKIYSSIFEKKRSIYGLIFHSTLLKKERSDSVIVYVCYKIICFYLKKTSQLFFEATCVMDITHFNDFISVFQWIPVTFELNNGKKYHIRFILIYVIICVLINYYYSEWREDILYVNEFIAFFCCTFDVCTVI